MVSPALELAERESPGTRRTSPYGPITVAVSGSWIWRVTS